MFEPVRFFLLSLSFQAHRQLAIFLWAFLLECSALQHCSHHGLITPSHKLNLSKINIIFSESGYGYIWDYIMGVADHLFKLNKILVNFVNIVIRGAIDHFVFVLEHFLCHYTFSLSIDLSRSRLMLFNFWEGKFIIKIESSERKSCIYSRQ